jgi:hypothetical protein
VGYAISNSFSYELGLFHPLRHLALLRRAPGNSVPLVTQRATVDDIIRARLFEAQVNREAARQRGTRRLVKVGQ